MGYLSVEQYFCTVLTPLPCKQCNSLPPYHVFPAHSADRCTVFLKYKFCYLLQSTAGSIYDLPAHFFKVDTRGGGGVSTMWRYREVLPVFEPDNIVSLGEGMTPILILKHLRAKYELPHFFIKDESANPTGSFKAVD